jgi:hypothetical protein
MTNGERFEWFLKERFTSGDWSDFLSADQSSLSRRKILEACHLARSVLYQNSFIKKRLAEVEAELRCGGVLKKLDSKIDTPSEETSLWMVIAEMEERLKILDKDVYFLSLSVESVCGYIKNLGKE